ncbi:leucine-rich repeat-containing protein 43 [Larimichthys crocea]|uniref:leucine-rich repeat-containing protein 43 n=1 Tax=Larimichthys crocea TaxID=215358 RepID=UPI000F5E0906|nr:leucine-rich repeat-containing protein 43 [Larimichthys crocea]
MSSKTLSAVLQKRIRRLCLNDFPCGPVNWTKNCPDRADTEDIDARLDLLRCPHSPWKSDPSWSPQAPALRELAVLTPGHLNDRFIYNYFTTLRIVDKGVSVIDEGLLKFSKLEELVLTSNEITEISAQNLPSTLKILELRANRLSALDGLTSSPPPRLHHLGLGSNSFGSHGDVFQLTGKHWPQLLSLDLGDCEFQDQQALVNTLTTLPCLRTLVLEGNPFTLASCYPGFTLDSLPRLSYLDTLQISPDERHRFRGLAKMSDLTVDRASATVSIGRMRGIPDPLSADNGTNSDFPVVTYGYFITYDFCGHEIPADPKLDSESKLDASTTAHVTEDGFSDADLQSNRNCEKETSKLDTRDSMVYAERTCHEIAQVSRHSTAKLTWSECMDFSDTQTYVVRNLGGLKRFFNLGLNLQIEEEKVLSWPAVSKDITMTKSSQNEKEKKGGKDKQTSVKSGSTKEKSKDKKKKSAPELVHDAPIRRLLGSVHVPLQSLTRRGQRVDVLCDFGVLHTEEAPQTLEKAS